MCPWESISENRDLRQSRLKTVQGLPASIDNAYYPADV